MTADRAEPPRSVSNVRKLPRQFRRNERDVKKMVGALKSRGAPSEARGNGLAIIAATVELMARRAGNRIAV